MTDIVPPIDLAALRQHVERLHRLAEAYGVGSLKLVANGLDPQQLRPLPLIEQSFPIGAIDPMSKSRKFSAVSSPMNWAKSLALKAIYGIT